MFGGKQVVVCGYGEVSQTLLEHLFTVQSKVAQIILIWAFSYMVLNQIQVRCLQSELRVNIHIGNHVTLQGGWSVKTLVHITNVEWRLIMILPDEPSPTIALVCFHENSTSPAIMGLQNFMNLICSILSYYGCYAVVFF